MVTLSYTGRVGQTLETIGTGLRDMTVVDTVNGAVVVATSGGGGGLMSVSISTTGQAQVLDSFVFSPSVSNAVDAQVSVVSSGQVTRVLVGRSGSDTALGYELDTGGDFGNRSDLSGTGLATDSAAGFQQVHTDFVFQAGSDGVLRCYRLDSSGGLIVGPSVQDTADTYHATPQAMAELTLGNRSFLLTACGDDTGISLFELNQSTGQINHSDALTPALGLGLHEVPVAIETAQVAGRAYAVIASASAQGGSAALSVVEITQQGRMEVTDHILDSLNTRFGRVTGLDVATVNGQTFVAAAGGDQGVSLFALVPGGRLVHLHSMAGTLQAGLQSIADLALVAQDDALHVLVADQAETGLMHLSAGVSVGQTRVAGLAGETLNGSSADDILVGGGSGDRLWGGNGDDILLDGNGRDTLYGGAGADRFMFELDGERDRINDFDPLVDKLDLSLTPFLYSNAQLEVYTTIGGAQLRYRGEVLDIRSASGANLTEADILGAVLWDTDRPPLILRQSLSGGREADTLVGDDGQDLIRGNDGNDRLSGMAGEDEINGGAGNDTIYGDDGGDLIRGGLGRDEVHLGAGDDVFDDEDETGIDGRDTIYGGGGNDTIRALGGDDLVFGGEGRDLVHMGLGNDVFVDSAQGGEEGRDTVFAGAGNDIIQGGNGDDAFHGEWDNDLIIARLGNDSVYGGTGYDSIYAGDGDDTVWAGDGRDLTFLGFGNDLFFDTEQGGIHGRDTVFSGWGNDRIEGGAGDDAFHGEGGNDILNGRGDNDLLFGGAGFDTIYGGTGNDSVWGGDGRDLIYLQEGDDLFVDNAQGGDFGRDTVFAGSGNDEIQGGNGDDDFYGGWGSDTLVGRKGNDKLFGGVGYDTIYAGEDNDTVWAGNGRDLVYLGSGHDVFVDTDQGGIEGFDTVWGGWGNDTFQGGAGNDQFAGQEHNDLIMGRKGNDLLFGGNGNDTLDGGLGDDAIWGGAGQDTFVFRNGDGRDAIYTFDGTQDDILLDRALWGGGYLSAQQVISTYARVSDGMVILDFGSDEMHLHGVQSVSALTGTLDFL